MSTSKTTTTTTQQATTFPQQGTTQTDESSNPQQGQGVTSTDVKKNVGRTPPTVKDIRKLFVGGLPSNVNDQLFREFFEFFGEVSDSIVMIDRETGHSRGFGFVTFREEETAYKVLGGKENSINTIGIFGKLCEVKVSIPKQHSSSSSGNSSNRRNNKSSSSSGSNSRNQESYGSSTNNDAVMSHEMGASFSHHGVQDGYIENYQYGNYMMANGTYMPLPPPYPHHYDMMGYNPAMNHPANYNYHLPPPHFQPSGSYYTVQSPPPFSHNGGNPHTLAPVPQQQQQPHPMPPFMNSGYPVNTNYSGVAQDQAVVSSSSSYDQNYPPGPPMTYPDQQMSQQLPTTGVAPPPPSVPHVQYPNNTMLYPTSNPAASHGIMVVPPNNYVHHPIPYNVVQGAGAGTGAVDTNNNNNNDNNESSHSPCSYPEEISNVTECEDLDQEKNNE